MEIRTLKDLRDFLDTLSEEQLTQRACIYKDDEHYYLEEVSFNEEDMVWNQDMVEGSIPTSEYLPEDFDDRPLEHPSNHFMPKGSIVIISAY